MRDDATGLAMTEACKSHIAIENEILELFAPVDHQLGVNTVPFRNNKASLWRADAIHRANSLAQLALSLATLGEHSSRCWLPNGLVAEARRLSRAYAELGQACGHGGAVPCAPLLADIVTRLALIFGRARGITLSVEVEPVVLDPDVRRVLILMCSEMVINALKYAYPGNAGGTILVSLAECDGQILLVVEDEGVGITGGAANGQGNRLLDELGALCGASVHRGPGRRGTGCRVTSQLPSMMSLARQA